MQLEKQPTYDDLEQSEVIVREQPATCQLNVIGCSHHYTRVAQKVLL